MKKALIGLLVALMAVSSFGGVVAMWSTYGILDGPDGIADAGPWIFSEGANTTKAIWELVYTMKGADTYGEITWDADSGTYSYADGDVVLSTRTSSGSASWDQDGVSISSDEYGVPGEGSDYVNLTTTYTEGNLYAAIFQYCGDDVYYALTPLNEAVNWNNDGMGTGSEVNFNMAGDTKLEKLGSITPGPGPQPPVVTPEPATMSLLGLGALAMVLRRKLRK